MAKKRNTKPRTWAELAAQVGRTPAAISQHRRRPDFPFDKIPTVEKYREWMEANLAVGSTSSGEAALKEEKLREEIRKLRHANEVEEARYVLREEAERQLVACVLAVRRAMEDLPRMAPAAIEGLGASQRRELQKYLEEWVADVCGRFAGK